MQFQIACGHTVPVQPWTCWLRLIHEPCGQCERDAIIARFNIPQTGDAGNGHEADTSITTENDASGRP